MEMRLLLFLLIKLALFETIGGELRIRPSGPNFIKTAGSSTVFTCEYISNGEDDGSEPFVWLDNKGEVVGAQNRRYIEDDLGIKKLYIISISEDDAGEYKCVKGAESKSIYLQIFKDITFDDAPLVQQLNISSDGTIRCVVSGNPEPSMSWRKNLRRIGMTDQSRFIVTREGLKVLNVTREDEGLYTCRAEVEVSGRYSEHRIQVFVNYPPTILGNLNQVDALLGSQTVISCPVLGFPTPRVNFTKEEEEISSVPDAIMANNTLTFANISESHEGRYMCIATNILGRDFRMFALNVLVPPKVIIPPLVTTVVGSEVSMSCLGTGNPLPYMMMSRKMDGRNLFEGEESSSSRMQASRSIGALNVTIATATVEDSDIFTCTASSPIGQSSEDVRLVVQYRPRFEVGSMTSLVYGWGNQVVQMNCKVHGEPKVNIQWFKGQDLVTIGNENYREFETPSGNVLQVSLRRDSGESLYGTYTCRATNELGSDDFNFILQKPPVPEVVLERLRPDDVSIRINSHHILGEATFQVTHYLVSLVREDGLMLNTSVPIREIDQTSNFSTATSVIENLVPNASYNLFVSSVNPVGLGEAARVEFKTPESSYDQRLPMF